MSEFLSENVRRKIMAMDIFVGIMCVIAAGAGVWVWWMENGGRSE